MYTSFHHLPTTHQQEQLEHLVQLITDSLDLGAIIYYGSMTSSSVIKSCFAREGIASFYQYEYDLLIIPSLDEVCEDYELQDRIENRCRSYARVNATVRRLETVDALLRKGNRFFQAIFREGVLLYCRKGLTLSQASETACANLEEAGRDWNRLYRDAETFLSGAKFHAGNNERRHAVFQLHQATERICSAMIRLFTGLHTNTHNLNKLLRYTYLFSLEPSSVFPRNTREERHLFGLLFRGYSDARYREHFQISEGELNVLLRRVHQLLEVAACLGRGYLRNAQYKMVLNEQFRPQNDSLRP